MKGNLNIDNKKNSLTIKIKVFKPNNAILTLLLFLSLISFLFPLSILFIEELEIGFGFIITILIFWGSSFYFLRKFLWCFYGKEVVIIRDDELIHYINYGFLKDYLNKVHYNSIEVGYSFDKNPDDIILLTSDNKLTVDAMCFLVFILDKNNFIISNLQLDFKYIIELNRIISDKKTDNID